MLIAALTGNIASGKSEVARLLQAKGAFLIDADVLARRAVEPETPALAAIVARWGRRVVDPRGHLDRRALRQIVFGDPDELEALNQIVHPDVELLRQRDIEAARAAGARVVICDIPLLFERGMHTMFDPVILVDAPDSVRRERLIAGRDLAPDEADRMMAAQMPAAAKRAHASILIDNSGSLDALAERVDVVWRELMDRASTGAASTNEPP